MITTINEFKNYNSIVDVEYESGRTLDGSSAYIYTFSSDNYDYQLNFFNVAYSQYPSFSFKAKGPDDYFYDFDKVTNDDLYKVMNKISLIIDKHRKDFNIKGLVYSVSQNKKGRQRNLLYKRICANNNWQTIDTDGKVEIIF